jgi:hypothetical protein
MNLALGIHGVSNKLVKREKPLVSVCSICGEKKKAGTTMVVSMP